MDFLNVGYSDVFRNEEENVEKSDSTFWNFRGSKDAGC